MAQNKDGKTGEDSQMHCSGACIITVPRIKNYKIFIFSAQEEPLSDISDIRPIN